MENVVVGRHARIKKAIVGEGVRITSHAEIGYSPLKDRKRFTVTPRGITVVTQKNFEN